VKKFFTKTKNVATAAAWLLTAAVTAAQAQDRGAPIIFSSPKADAISTNLHEVNVKQSPFKNLESEIRKPFEVFDTSPARPRIKPPQHINGTPPPANKPNLKAILDKSVEEEFLNGHQRGQEDPNDPFKSPDASMDPLRRNKPKTALDRYYDRLEKEQGAKTNRSSTLDLFGNNKERTTEEKNALESNQRNKNAGASQDAFSRTGNQISNNAAADNVFSRTGKRPEGGRFSAPASDPFDRATLHRETRMENFKKLLEGPTYSQPQYNVNVPRSSSYGSVESSGQRPGYITPSPTTSSSKPYSSATIIPGSSFTKSSGIVGAAGRPAGLQEYSTTAGASLSTPVAPTLQPKMKPSTFSPPTRR
jgi:hypothetical protein